LAKWEEKKGHCNMVTVEPCKKPEAKRRSGRMGGNPREAFIREPTWNEEKVLGHNVEGNIRKVVQAPPKFDVMQEKNQFLHEAQKALGGRQHT
jgi:hypothetical protein